MARTARTIQDQSLLTAALEGLELQKERVEKQIREVRSLLGKKGSGRRGRPPGSGLGKKSGPGRLSVSARKRIAAAQKRRWAEYRKSASAKGE
jgi:hypothetical protein